MASSGLFTVFSFVHLIERWQAQSFSLIWTSLINLPSDVAARSTER